MNIAEKITKIYLSDEEWWHRYKLSYKDSVNYHRGMIAKGNIIYRTDSRETLIAYCEFLRINYEQWGRMVCDAKFYSYDENTTDGNICVVLNLWIDKNSRNTFVMKDLMNSFFKINGHCDYFVGHATAKKRNFVKVYDKKKFNKYIKNNDLSMVNI